MQLCPKWAENFHKSFPHGMEWRRKGRISTISELKRFFLSFFIHSQIEFWEVFKARMILHYLNFSRLCFEVKPNFEKWRKKQSEPNIGSGSGELVKFDKSVSRKVIVGEDTVFLICNSEHVKIENSAPVILYACSHIFIMLQFFKIIHSFPLSSPTCIDQIPQADGFGGNPLGHYWGNFMWCMVWQPICCPTFTFSLNFYAW